MLLHWCKLSRRGGIRISEHRCCDVALPAGWPGYIPAFEHNYSRVLSYYYRHHYRHYGWHRGWHYGWYHHRYRHYGYRYYPRYYGYYYPGAAVAGAALGLATLPFALAGGWPY